MPSIETASTPVSFYPNEFSSPYGNDGIVPLYSSVPLKSPVAGCLPCVVCGSSPIRNQIIANEGFSRGRGGGGGAIILTTIEPPIINYLIVGGGGAGGGGYNTAHGGGGGGQVISGTTTIVDEITYSIVVGLGGAGAGYIQTGTSGGVSSFNSVSALGGIHGNSNVLGLEYGAASGNGNAGGTPFYGSFIVNAGGGGGAGSLGGNAVNGSAGNGGAGVYSSITGTNLAYGGGGGGGAWGYHPNQLAGLGGVGGGGAGSNFWNPAISPPNSVGQNGLPNTGGGGGGTGVPGGLDPYAGSSSGGSGVVILSIPSYKYTGNVTGNVIVTDLGSKKLLTFRGNGTYTS